MQIVIQEEYDGHTFALWFLWNRFPQIRFVVDIMGTFFMDLLLMIHLSQNFLENSSILIVSKRQLCALYEFWEGFILAKNKNLPVYFFPVAKKKVWRISGRPVGTHEKEEKEKLDLLLAVYFFYYHLQRLGKGKQAYFFKLKYLPLQMVILPGICFDSDGKVMKPWSCPCPCLLAEW